MKKGAWRTILAVVFAAVAAFPVNAGTAASVDYIEAYTPAFAEAQQRNREFEDTKWYNKISYAYFDLQGDGIKELVFLKMYNKHGCQFWVYSYDGTSLYNLGTVENDADGDTVRGYKGGILYRESHKGNVRLYHASFSGGVGSVECLYDGKFDGMDPPSVEDLSDYYDPSGVTEVSGEWTKLDW